jgi:hypothetical protein
MTREGRDAFTGLNVPQLCGAVTSAADQTVTTRRERETKDIEVVLVRDELLNTATGAELPHID